MFQELRRLAIGSGDFRDQRLRSQARTINCALTTVANCGIRTFVVIARRLLGCRAARERQRSKPCPERFEGEEQRETTVPVGSLRSAPSHPCAPTFCANSFRLIHFRKNVSANPLVSHTFKTKDLKPFRFTHFQKKGRGWVPFSNIQPQTDQPTIRPGWSSRASGASRGTFPPTSAPRYAPEDWLG